MSWFTKPSVFDWAGCVFQRCGLAVFKMGIYVQMHSMHGLFRSQDLELGRDEDTGGQIVYVLELAKALGELKSVDKVDIITRRIVDTGYPGYSKKIETVTDKVSIVRIECGPKKYVMKVDLWPYLREFADNCKKYVRRVGRVPDVLQSNYADSGYVCSLLSKELKIPQVHTGHSLGIPKMKKLGVNHSNLAEFNKVYHFDKRLAAEQAAIDNSRAIVASTRQEIKEQYSGYKIGKKIEKFKVVAPGIDVKKFHPRSKKKRLSEDQKSIRQMFDNIVDQNFKRKRRTILATLSRLDKRKNVLGLMRLYSRDAQLRRYSNLMIFAETLRGGPEEQKLIRRINSVIRSRNLYDHLALPALHLEYETHVPEFYRYLADKHGIFINPALIEPFGLTVIEAMSCGVPVVATRHGGPSEIISDGENGYLVDPKNPKDVSRKIRKLVKNRELWHQFSERGIKHVKANYTWTAAARKYLKVFRGVESGV